MNIARKFHQRMIAQSKWKHAETNETMPKKRALKKQDATTKVNDMIN